jgi:coenzyme PQQ biosynthesis protein PqqD
MLRPRPASARAPSADIATVPRRRAGVLAQDVQGRTVLLRVDDGGYYAVEDVGARIWELCDGARSVSEIVATIHDEFDAPADVVQADVLEFLAELRREQLLAAAR